MHEDIPDGEQCGCIGERHERSCPWMNNFVSTFDITQDAPPVRPPSTRTVSQEKIENRGGTEGPPKSYEGDTGTGADVDTQVRRAQADLFGYTHPERRVENFPPMPYHQGKKFHERTVQDYEELIKEERTSPSYGQGEET